MSNINQSTVLLKNASGLDRQIGEIPDLWHIAIANKDKLQEEMILQVWHMAHDLKDAVSCERSAAITGVRYPKGMEPPNNQQAIDPGNVDWIPDQLRLEREPETNGREATDDERAAIVKLFDGYDPSILIVFDHYISDGPGYRGWIAITVGGEPHYCATFTKDEAGEIEICCEARDIGLESVDFPEEARP